MSASGSCGPSALASPIAMPRSDEERLDLSGMRIGELRPSQLGGLRALRTLVLRHNALRALPPLGGFPLLESLDLSHNELSELGPDVLAGCARLRWLDVAHNGLRELPAAGGCWQLEALRLDRNRIEQLHGVPHALPLSLAQLSLRENAIASPQQLRFLASLAQLRALELAPSPLGSAAAEQRTPLQPLLAFLLPSLVALDRQLIGNIDRSAAARLFADLRPADGCAHAHAPIRPPTGAPAIVALDPALLRLLRPPCTDDALWAHLRAHAHAAAAAASAAAAGGCAPCAAPCPLPPAQWGRAADAQGGRAAVSGDGSGASCRAEITASRQAAADVAADRVAPLAGGAWPHGDYLPPDACAPWAADGGRGAATSPAGPRGGAGACARACAVDAHAHSPALLAGGYGAAQPAHAAAVGECASGVRMGDARRYAGDVPSAERAPPGRPGERIDTQQPADASSWAFDALQQEVRELREAVRQIAPPRTLRALGARASARRQAAAGERNAACVGGVHSSCAIRCVAAPRSPWAPGGGSLDGSDSSTVGSAQRELPTVDAVALRFAPALLRADGAPRGPAAGVASRGEQPAPLDGHGARQRAAACALQAAARGRLVRRQLTVALRWRRATIALQAAWRGRRVRAAAAAAQCAPALLRRRLEAADGAIAQLRTELEHERLMRAVQHDALRVLWAQLVALLPPGQAPLGGAAAGTGSGGRSPEADAREGASASSDGGSDEVSPRPSELGSAVETAADADWESVPSTQRG